MEESWQFVGLYDRRIEVRFPDKTISLFYKVSRTVIWPTHPTIQREQWEKRSEREVSRS